MNEVAFFLMVISLCECLRLAIEWNNRAIKLHFQLRENEMVMNCKKHTKDADDSKARLFQDVTRLQDVIALLHKQMHDHKCEVKE